MLLPQNEAKFKFCPFLATPDGKFRTCQGSQCLMWRYKSQDQTAEDAPGYCGLAGRPAGVGKDG